MDRLPPKYLAIGLSAALTNVLFWGVAAPIIKVGLEVISPFIFLYYRFVIVVALTTPVLFLFRKSFNTIKTSKHLWDMLVIGLLTHPISLGLLFFGLQYTTSADGAILAALAPLFVVFASWIFLKERITRSELLGLIIASVGTVLIIFDTPRQANASNPIFGDLLILSSNVFWTIGVLWMKKLALKHSPLLFGYTGWLTGMVVFGAIALYTDPVLFFRPLALTQIPEAAFGIVYMAVFGSLVAFTAYQVAQKYLDASNVSIFAYLEPLIAVPLSYFWLHEKFGRWFVVGGIVLAIGVLLAEYHPHSRIAYLKAHITGKGFEYSPLTRLPKRKKRPSGRSSR